MDFYSIEAQDAVRFSWNVFPSTKPNLTKVNVPFGCLYSPMKDIENVLFVEYKPLKCTKCEVILNPACKVDFKGKWWSCPFCTNRTQFPKEYGDNISETQLPAELMQDYSTMEYLLPVPNLQNLPPSIYLYLIDTCLPDTELQAIKDSISQSLSLMPPETWVALITFGRHVFVHELSHSECPKSYAFRGDKDYTAAQIQEMLSISSKHDPRGPQATGGIKKFAVPFSDCEATFNAILDELEPDPWPVTNTERALRATGAALNIAVSLLEAAFPGQGSRILTLISGPCTIGSGQVVGVKLEETIRNWIDIQKDNDMNKYNKKATKFYQSLAQRAIKSGQTIDIFAYTTDQFGLLEMKSLAENTGGLSITNELFASQVFKDTFKKVFDKDADGHLRFGLCGTIQVILSKDLRVSGAIGPCTSLKKAGPMVAEGPEIGQGGTTEWYIGGLDKNSTVGFYFDLPSQNTAGTQMKTGFIQFLTKYRHPSGQYRMRVTTLQRRFGDPNNLNDMTQGFDQEAASCLVSRLAIHKTEIEEPIEVIRWLDKTLIRVASKFADFYKDSIGSFKLPKEFSLFPQFMYHLRRSNFVQTFAASPDESAFFRGMLCRENTTNATVMIQPSLLLYSFEIPEPTPVVLDITSMKNNVILLLDTFFDVVVWQGEMIKKWQQAGYQNQPEYENFRTLLQAPMDDAKLIIDDRYPAPHFFLTWPGHTKERKVKSRVNPSALELDNATCQGGDFINDDASLQMFMNHLIKLVVTTPSS